MDSNQTLQSPTYKKDPPYGASASKWIIFFIVPYRWRLLFYFFINVIRQSLFLAQPLFFSHLVALIDSGTFKNDPDQFVILLVFYAIIAFLVFISIGVVMPSGRLIDLVSKDLSLFGFKHYTKLSEHWHENRASGEKLQRLITARTSIFRFIIDGYWRLAPIPAIFIALTGSVIALDVPLKYIFMVLGMAVTYIFISSYTGRWMNRKFAQFNASQENVIGGVYEFIVSTSTMRFFNLRDHALKKARALEWHNHKDRNSIFVTVFLRWFLINCTVLVWIMPLLYFSGLDAIAGTLSIAAFSAMAFFALYMWAMLEPLAMAYVDLIEQWEGIKRLTHVLNESPDIQDAPDAHILKTTEPSIQFEHVRFHYQEGNSIIDNLNLTINAHEKIGLIGPSGAGKSTILKLLMRFYDVESGTIRIAGHDIRDVSRHSLQDSIAVIPQDVVLFNHPLIENIRYGNLDATDEQVFEATRKANADGFIRTLPDGYQTLVGERGVKLSGGQRQRIAIARAILKDAPILILDEATSALDSESEKLIQNSLESLMKGKTVIAIAHRLSTIAHLDRLVVMDNGTIAEQGTHETLLTQNGLYAKLWSMQSGGFLAD